MDRKEIARRLIEARGPISQQKAADKIGISRSSLAMYELGLRVPKDDVKILISKGYGIPVGDLFFAPGGHESGPDTV